MRRAWKEVTCVCFAFALACFQASFLEIVRRSIRASLSRGREMQTYRNFETLRERGGGAGFARIVGLMKPRCSSSCVHRLWSKRDVFSP